ncbi:hypothetical protein ACFXKR_18020 [Streptomyces violascens]|uniref:hypothetical protein n=1 Tax=Streptomyces violascens TaxID=67381 RepID=UPI0036738952
MMYGLLLPEGGIFNHLSAILAEGFHVAVAQTDVSDSSELENRNWDAVITCVYERLDGDLAWSLGIYASDDVAHHPSEAQLASLVAQRLGAPVFFSWEGGLPWIRTVALPDGGTTLARTTELNDNKSGFAVEAAEASVPGFPRLRVTHLPEVVRAFQIPTPLTDAAVPPCAGDDLGNIRSLLVTWERLGIRMSTNWPPGGWYSALLYKEDLEYRSQLESNLPDIEECRRRQLEAVVSQLDAVYRDLTIDDGGHALSSQLQGKTEDLASLPWYWHRHPSTLGVNAEPGEATYFGIAGSLGIETPEELEDGSGPNDTDRP